MSGNILQQQQQNTSFTEKQVSHTVLEHRKAQ